MIDLLKQQFTSVMSNEEKLNRVRELLQLTCLKIIYDKDFFRNIAFTGGTALRIIFDMRRFSEDLDFSLVNKKGYNFFNINSELIRGFGLYGLKIESVPKVDKNVHSAFLKFGGLLKEVGLSPLESQKLSIKIEIDTNPPKGGNSLTTFVDKTYTLNIHHFDLPSMFATKLCACFYRKYTKGRDFYDLIWYAGRKVKPNYLLMNNAIKQVRDKNPEIDEHNFKDFLLTHIEKIDFNIVKKDVERFLEDKGELRIFELKAIKNAIDITY